MWTLEDFVRESNLIEGIDDVSGTEVRAHERLLSCEKLTVDDVVAFVAVIAPGKPLRTRANLNVKIVDAEGRTTFVAPRGGRHIRIALAALIAGANTRTRPFTPYSVHRQYETLHPFMDGNGRSGRALWLWQMGGEAPIGFLHRFYYQTLDAAR